MSSLITAKVPRYEGWMIKNELKTNSDIKYIYFSDRTYLSGDSNTMYL